MKSGDEIVVSVKSCGINFADILICAGKYQVKVNPPFVAGVDFSGDVISVGSNVKTVAEGDRIVAMSNDGGGFGTRCKIDHRNVWKIPDSMDYKTASSFLISYATGLLALSRKACLKAGETVLVTAAAGGTGLAAVDIAANVFGAKVIGACGGEEKCELVKQKGAQYTIDYKKENIRDRIKEITEGKGINVVFDPVGGDLFIDCLKSLSYEGRILTIGYATGKIPQIPANLVLLKSASVIGAWFGEYKQQNKEVFNETINDVIRLYAEGKINPHIGQIFPLSQINEAFGYVLSRKSTGKVIVTMGQS